VTLAPGDRFITVQTGKGPITFKCEPPAVGDRALFFPDGKGGFIAHKYTAPAIGDRFIAIPTRTGIPIAMGLDIFGPPLNAIVCPSAGTLLKTIDQGLVWGSQSSGSLPKVVGLAYVGGGVIIAATVSNGLWKSSDFGATWSSWLPLTAYPNGTINNIIFLSADNSIVAIQSDGIVTYVLKIDITTATVLSSTTLSVLDNCCMAYLGSGVMILCIPSTYKTIDVYKSYDNGGSWSHVTTLSGFPGCSQYGVPVTCVFGAGAICSTGNGHAYFVPYANVDSQAYTFVISDYGSTWTLKKTYPLYPGLNTAPWNPIYNGTIFSPKIGVIVVIGQSLLDGSYGNFYISKDHGYTWTLLFTLGGASTTRIFAWANLGGNIIVGYANDGAIIARSTDGGLTWSYFVSPSGNAGYSMAVFDK